MSRTADASACSDRANASLKDSSRIKNNSSDFKTLFVFDNFETTTSPLAVFQWLDSYVRGPNKY